MVQISVMCESVTVLLQFAYSWNFQLRFLCISKNKCFALFLNLVFCYSICM